MKETILPVSIIVEDVTARAARRIEVEEAIKQEMNNSEWIYKDSSEDVK